MADQTLQTLPNGTTENGVTPTSGGRQQYSDANGTYYRNEYNVGTQNYKTDYTFIPNAPAGGAVSPITPTTGYASSTTMAGAFANNSNTLDGKTPPPGTVTTTTGTGGANGTGTGTGTDGSTVTPNTDPNAPTKPNDAAGFNDVNGNPLQPVWDSENAKITADADALKQQTATMLQTNLANIDSTFAANTAAITAKWNSLIDTQTKIDTQTLATAKAYGIANGAQYTPVETQVALGDKEKAMATNIQSLDSQRDAELQQARAARDTGDAAALQGSMDKIAEIEKTMNDQMTNLSKEISDKYDLAQKVKTDQDAQYAKAKAAWVSSVVAAHWQDFANATTPEEKDKVIKDIMNKNGVDPSKTDAYADLYSALGNEVITQQKQQTDTTKAALDITKTQGDIAKNTADIANTKANTAKTYADIAKANAANQGTNADGSTTTPAQTSFFQNVDKLVTGNAKNASGVPMLDDKGYLTAEGFKAVVAEAQKNNLSQADVVAKYKDKLYLNKYKYAKNYGFSQAEFDTLTKQ